MRRERDVLLTFSALFLFYLSPPTFPGLRSLVLGAFVTGNCLSPYFLPFAFPRTPKVWILPVDLATPKTPFRRKTLSYTGHQYSPGDGLGVSEDNPVQLETRRRHICNGTWQALGVGNLWKNRSKRPLTGSLGYARLFVAWDSAVEDLLIGRLIPYHNPRKF